ncbi:MAG: biotin/lipoyl-binding protein [Bacteroidaceae bacterium]|nr:biotin/lipoyl-binding protein [Bacteroidaceae bacterium]
MKKFKYTIGGNQYEVVINSVENNVAELEVNGKSFSVAIEEEESTVAPRPVIKRPTQSAAPVAAAAPAAPRAAGKGAVSAPLPGTITNVLVSAGQSVKRGDVLLTMEAMKMENNIQADRDCTVKAVLVQKGQSVLQGDALVDVE